MTAAQRAQLFLSRHWNALFLVIAGIVLALLVVRNTAIALAIPKHPELALRLNPSSGEALDSYATELANSADPNDQAKAAIFAVRALRESPLFSRPFLIVALQHERAGQSAVAIAVMNIAARRDPRSFSVRQWLLQHQLERGDYAAAIDEVDAMTRLRPELRVQYATALASLLEIPEARQPLAKALADNPLWQWEFLSAAVRAPGDHRPLYAILRAVIRNPASQISTGMLSIILNDMIHNGDVAIAKSIFDEMAKPDDDSNNLVFDGSFRRQQAPQPFNWMLSSTATGVASFDIDSVGGTTLLVRRFGSELASLAGEVLTLPPGRYELTTRVRADDVPLDNSLSWRITCLADNRMVARVDNPPATSGSADLKTSFQIGPDCPGQQLGLWTEAMDGSSSGAARYNFVAIRRVGDLGSAE